MPTKRQVLAALLGIAAAVVCGRLGFWQLARLKGRRLVNDVIAARLFHDPVPPFNLPPGTRHWRRVTISGTFDFDHQIVLVDRSLDGAPGVNIITPLNPNVPAPALLIDRGWVYSPDAQHVDLSKYGETPTQTITGWIEEFVYDDRGPPRTASTPNGWRYLFADSIQRAFPFPVGPFYLIAQADSAVKPSPTSPVRLPLPSRDPGPHLSYAIQWFSFAVIALVGASIVIYKDRTGAATPAA